MVICKKLEIQEFERCIQNPVKHLKWTFQKKQLPAFTKISVSSQQTFTYLKLTIETL